jgi:phage shock protein PspC (stress-responsive transcriptional regulator)
MKLNITLDGRRFYRSNSDAWLVGICGGLARHFRWNPMLVRGVVAILAIAVPGISTIGMILAYIVLGLLIPSEDQA